ncbi:MAG: ATP-binding cassette domain-containing protein [Cyanobacteria bacterium P01_H01_bin.74]
MTDQTNAHPKNAESQLLIRVTGIKKSFGDNQVLDGVSFHVNAHETVGIIGISGCGKSTLLRIISGLEAADAGEVCLGSQNFSLVFQYSALFDSLTVLENVAFSLTEKSDTEFQKALQSGKNQSPLSKRTAQVSLTSGEIRQLALEKLRLLGLEGIEDLYPNELSGGMKKRVSFARAIAANPGIILYDEPTAGLDPIASTMIEDYMEKMRSEMNAASIVVTHQFSTIARTNRVILLHKGCIQWTGTPDELRYTSNPYARQFADARVEGPMALEHR